MSTVPQPHFLDGLVSCWNGVYVISISTTARNNWKVWNGFCAGQIFCRLWALFLRDDPLKTLGFLVWFCLSTMKSFCLFYCLMMWMPQSWPDLILMAYGFFYTFYVKIAQWNALMLCFSLPCFPVNSFPTCVDNNCLTYIIGYPPYTQRCTSKYVCNPELDAPKI